MTTFLPKEDFEIQKDFGTILSIENFSNYINEIVELIHINQFNKANLDRVLMENNIKLIDDIKEELLDLLLVYINLILNDNIIDENEARSVNILKRVFKIREGDFYNYRFDEVEEVLNRQLERLYSDNQIDKEEGLFKVELQECLI